MNIKLQDTIKEQLSVLRKENQEAINSLDWVKISEEIIKKYLTEEEKISAFQLETFLVLVGLVEDEEKYKENLENHVSLTADEILKITTEAREKIFLPVYNFLIESIKKSLKDRNIHWQQNLGFILSGGDYTAFIREPIKENENKIPDPKDSFNPSKIDDLKSKFTI
jgi:hypothetical protein